MTCARSCWVEGSVRLCHLPAGHNGAHVVIYLQAPVIVIT